MKSLIPFFVLLILFSTGWSSDTPNWQLIPFPNDINYQKGSFSFNEGMEVKNEFEELEGSINLFKAKLSEFNFIPTNKNPNKIILNLSKNFSTNTEAYQLKISPKTIKLTASDPAGIYYGLMTLWQQILLSGKSEIPCGTIKDEPRFVYRGFMLDESRHFFGMEKIKQILDLMSKLKLNKFHWHLTDSPGWRIEIKKYPKLTSIGGIGNHTDPEAEAKFYTQEEIKEIVSYAAARNIEIIPEIDMPGHATAANRAYPEFSGGGSKKYPNFTFNPGKEETYQYLTDILREVAELFPSKYIHFGGDEVHFGNHQWKSDRNIKNYMKNHGLNSLKEMEFHFSNRISDSIQSLGKVTAGWDEIVNAGLTRENTLVYWWRHDQPQQLQTALEKGYQTILCPRRPLYFDFVQHESHKNGRRWNGFNPLEDVYNYPDSHHEITEKWKALILGIQGNLWTEVVTSEKWLDFLSLPRMIALAESAWTMQENKDIERFDRNLKKAHNYMDELGLYYFNRFE